MVWHINEIPTLSNIHQPEINTICLNIHHLTLLTLKLSRIGSVCLITQWAHIEGDREWPRATSIPFRNRRIWSDALNWICGLDHKTYLLMFRRNASMLEGVRDLLRLLTPAERRLRLRPEMWNGFLRENVHRRSCDLWYFKLSYQTYIWQQSKMSTDGLWYVRAVNIVAGPKPPKNKENIEESQSDRFKCVSASGFSAMGRKRVLTLNMFSRETN